MSSACLPVEKVLHVLGHDLGDILQILVEFCQVGLCPGVLVHALCVLHKRVCSSIQFPESFVVVIVDFVGNETINSQLSHLFYLTIKSKQQQIKTKRARNKRTEPSKGVRTKAGSVNLVAIAHKEFFGEIVQVCEGQLARVVALAYAQVDNSMVNDVTRRTTMRQGMIKYIG